MFNEGKRLRRDLLGLLLQHYFKEAAGKMLLSLESRSFRDYCSLLDIVQFPVEGIRQEREGAGKASLKRTVLLVSARRGDNRERERKHTIFLDSALQEKTSE